MNLKYILRKDKKPNEFGEYGIYLQGVTQGVAVKVSTQIFVTEAFWLGDDGRTTKFVMIGKNGHPKGDLLNKKLQYLKREKQDIIDKLMVDSRCVLTVQMLRSILNGTYEDNTEAQSGKVPFVDFVLSCNHDRYELGKISYSVWANIECNMRQFKKFLQTTFKKDTNENNVLYCRDLKPDHIKKFILWIKNNKNKNETINHALTPIFVAVKLMSRNKWIESEVCEDILNMYLPANAASLSESDTKAIKYLTQDQIFQIIKLKDSCKYPRTKELIDMFLFSLSCNGLRFSDICTLRWSEIDMDKRTITHMLVKNHTKEPTVLTIYICDGAMKILERWKDRFDNFVFGLLPDEFNLDDEVMLKQYINSKDKTMNQSLRCLGEKMKLPFKLHFHVARHTYATLAVNSGVDIHTVSHNVGHSSSAVTEKVYASLYPETLKKTVMEKLNFDFEKEIEYEME